MNRRRDGESTPSMRSRRLVYWYHGGLELGVQMALDIDWLSTGLRLREENEWLVWCVYLPSAIANTHILESS